MITEAAKGEGFGILVKLLFDLVVAYVKEQSMVFKYLFQLEARSKIDAFLFEKQFCKK